MVLSSLKNRTRLMSNIATHMQLAIITYTHNMSSLSIYANIILI